MLVVISTGKLSGAFHPNLAGSQIQRWMGLGWLHQGCGEKALSIFSYLQVLVASDHILHISFMSTTEPLFLLAVHERPVIHSLSLDDSSHELLLVHRGTDDFQVIGVDDDLAEIYDWGRLKKEVVSVSPV